MLATPSGFEPPISTLTGWRVKPLHHGASRWSVWTGRIVGQPSACPMHNNEYSPSTSSRDARAVYYSWRGRQHGSWSAWRSWSPAAGQSRRRLKLARSAARQAQGTRLAGPASRSTDSGPRHLCCPSCCRILNVWRERDRSHRPGCAASAAAASPRRTAARSRPAAGTSSGRRA